MRKSSILFWLAIGMALGQGPKTAPMAPKTGPDVITETLGQLAQQYQSGDNKAKDMARERDRLAIQAQSAIIGLKDAELQMERAISAGRDVCGKVGMVLSTVAAGWGCESPKPAGKDVDKK